MTNRFKGLNLIDKVPEELWMEVPDIVQEAVIKTIPPKRNAKQRPHKHLRKEEKLKAKEKGKLYPFECRVHKNSKESKESLP